MLIYKFPAQVPGRVNLFGNQRIPLIHPKQRLQAAALYPGYFIQRAARQGHPKRFTTYRYISGVLNRTQKAVFGEVAQTFE